jgi:hypothetical protein
MPAPHQPRARLIRHIEMVAARLAKTTYPTEQAAQLLRDLFPEATIGETSAALHASAARPKPGTYTPNRIITVRLRDALRYLRRRRERE